MPDKRHHHYLNKIGVNSTDVLTFNTYEKPRKGFKKRFEKQRDKYGFDERETWSLDYTTAGWIYEHLKLYKKLAGKSVDLTYHKIAVQVLDKNLERLEYKTHEEELQLDEAIDLTCKYLEKYYRHVASFEADDENKAYKELKCALHIYADICAYLWW